MMANEHARSQGDDLDCAVWSRSSPTTSRTRCRSSNSAASRTACPGCAEYVAQMRAMAGSPGGLCEDAIPTDLRDAVLAAFSELPKS
jgi:hypothetical protein